MVVALERVALEVVVVVQLPESERLLGGEEILEEVAVAIVAIAAPEVVEVADKFHLTSFSAEELPVCKYLAELCGERCYL